MLLPLLPLLSLLPVVSCRTWVSLNATHRQGLYYEESDMMKRPLISNCRSPNMEDFSCWWLPLDNLTDGEAVDYVFTYVIGSDTSVRGCPDYKSAGENSCHFDRSHTSIWTVYCMSVTAVTARRNYTAPRLCLDVADIVKTEAPVDLAYKLIDAGGDEIGYNVHLSWTYPVPSHLEHGWITLEYELQYRWVSEPDNWKVKYPLKDPEVELLGLPIANYVFRVRCRSHNYGQWSDWSHSLLLSIPNKLPVGKLVVLILVTGVGVMALLVIAFGVIPQGRRIKEYFLPQIPKPRIMGVDPRLLKKGNLDEINRHFSNFHSYRPPSYTEEVWDQVSADSFFLAKPTDFAELAGREKDASAVPGDLVPLAAALQTSASLQTSSAQDPASYLQGMSPYCALPPPLQAPPSPWSRPEIVALPGTDYSVMGNPLAAPEAAAATAAVPPERSPQDFYTCVQLMNDSGEVHLVSCLPPPYCREFPPFSAGGEREEKKRKLDEYQSRKNLRNEAEDGGEKGEASVPLLPVAVDNKG